MASILDAYNFVQQQGQVGRGNRLNMLLGKAYQQPDQRQDFLGQAAQVDAGAAMQAEQAFQQQGDQDMVRAAKAAAFLASVPEQSRPQVYQQMLPSLSKIPALKGVLPPQYDEQVAGLVNSFAQTYGIGSQGAPSGYREFELMANAGGLQGDDRQKAARVALGLEGRAASGGMSFDMIKGGDGVERPARRNPRDGSVEVFDGQQWVPLGGQVQSQPAQGGIRIDPAMFQGLEPSSQQALLQQIMADANGQPMAPQGGSAGALAIGRRPEDEAAAVEQAKLRANLSMAPQVAAADANRARMVSEAQESGKAAADVARNAPKAVEKANATIALLDKAIAHPGREAATGLSSAIDPRNMVRGTAAKDYQVLAAQLEGRAFLEAFESLKGGGAITQIEGQKATDAMARLNRAQSDGEYLAALNELRDIALSAKARAESNMGQSSAIERPPAPGARKAPDGNWYIQQNGKYFKVE